ncbi:MAG: GNAT family N-acetyltransferase [Candidatus Lokiarchaeota archaeon]|nr:GNAT family N-acetyltransferase [Candidatus Lokiarchaeota archaeon]
MKLPIKDITPELEERIKEDIHHKFIHAEIREATEEDLESILLIYNRSWLTSREPFSRLSVDSLRIIFEDQDTTMLIAKIYGMDAGFLITDFEGENKEYGVIAGLAVLPRFQRKGIGKILGMAAWNYFKERGIKELRCEVYVDNKVSYNFIKSLGFKEFDKKRYKKEDFRGEETS